MLITNGKIVSWGQNAEIMEGKALRLQDGLIEAIAEESLLRRAYPEDAILDAGGQLVMAGNICAHTHFYGAFSRGMAIPGEPPRGFSSNLKQPLVEIGQSPGRRGRPLFRPGLPGGRD